MNDLTIKQINNLVILQRNYRTLKTNVDNINKTLYLYQNILINMLNNLIYCNKFGIYIKESNNFLTILNELGNIKELIYELPETVRICDLTNYTTSDINTKLYKIYNALLKYSNHISCSCFDELMELFIGKKWKNNYTFEELQIFDFINRLFRPISIWDSVYHKSDIKYDEIEDEKKKNATLAKDLLNTLMKQNNSVTTIMEGDNHMPIFLKNITDIINTQEQPNRDNGFKAYDCINILGLNNIVIKKNTKSNNLYESNYGSCIYINYNNRYIVVQGLFKDDVLNVSRNFSYIKKIVKKHQLILLTTHKNISYGFKNNYLDIMTLRDIVVNSSEEISDTISKKYNEYTLLQNKELTTLINDFLLASKYRKIDMLTLLLIGNSDDKKYGYLLYESLKIKNRTGIANEIYDSLHYKIKEQLTISEKVMKDEQRKIEKITASDIPYEKRISLLKVSDDIKNKAYEKLKSIKSNMQGDSKAQAWLDGFLKIPFGQYSENEMISFKNNFINKLNNGLTTEFEITNYINELEKEEPENDLILEWNKYLIDRVDYLKDVRTKLDKAVYGHKEAKTQLERIFAQWINGSTKGAILGIQGPPGNGKTTLAKYGLSQCLVDKKGNPRPFQFLAIGGSVNGSTLVGHNYTYVGSTWGKIVDMLVTSKCMNPIIFIDEIDKVSTTEHGREIISILTHLTDLTQNDEFEDKYFTGVKLDLSKALIVFSFNDPNLIDPILKDRITVIETKPLKIDEKLEIIKSYMFPEILNDVGFNNQQIILSDDMSKFIIETYTLEGGVRKVKEKLQEIVRDINLNRFHNPHKYQLPFIITQEYVEELFASKPKIRSKKIHEEPVVGLVNGLYATTVGIGGLTPIQIIKYPCDTCLSVKMTGTLGDVMKESIEYAKNIAYSLLTDEEKTKLYEHMEVSKLKGFHIHCPDGATPKDGPSAGAAITLAFYSIFTNKPIRNDIALTGEINLSKNVTAIGGVHSKLTGAKNAGVKLALIPEENMEDLQILRNENQSPEDDDFIVKPIKTIYDVIENCLLN